jgi:hypothetical protein
MEDDHSTLNACIQGAKQLLAQEARGVQTPDEVDSRLVQFFRWVEPSEVAALLSVLPAAHQDRLRAELRRYPSSELDWEQLHWVSGSVGAGNVVCARGREEFMQLERERWAAEKQRVRQAVDRLRAHFAAQ